MSFIVVPFKVSIYGWVTPPLARCCCCCMDYRANHWSYSTERKAWVPISIPKYRSNSTKSPVQLLYSCGRSYCYKDYLKGRQNDFLFSLFWVYFNSLNITIFEQRPACIANVIQKGNKKVVTNIVCYQTVFSRNNYWPKIYDIEYYRIHTRNTKN